MNISLKKKFMSLVLCLCMICPNLILNSPAYSSDELSLDVNVPFRSDVKFEAGIYNDISSQSYRIPSMVTLKDGTIVAAADIRWNTTYDGGGLDTLVASSEDGGVTWSYNAANYLGDNGNVYNGSSSTCFIDPCLTVSPDGETVYMLVDLYPYGVALNGSGNTAPSTEVGFNDDGYLLLSNNNHSTYSFYLKGNSIYDIYNNPVANYTVDEYFNLYYNGGTNPVGNLFYSDSPYKVVRTGFLYLTSSSDGGKSWSAPKLLNLKSSSEQVCLVGPGRGVTMADGTMVFPVYSYNGSTESQRMGFVYSKNGEDWERVDSSVAWSSEAAVVEVGTGTLRFFYRNGTSRLCYVDYDMTSQRWSTVVSTGVATNSNTQLSAITYSKTSEGKQVILVSCPTGPNAAGSNNNNGAYRLNGRIFIGTVNDNGTMTWSNSPINVTGTTAPSADSSSPYTEAEGFFAYSCLTERADGSIAILYENRENAWGSGDNCYYAMNMKAYSADDLGLAFDDQSSTDQPSNEITANGVTVSNDKIVFTGLSVTLGTVPTNSFINDAVAYNVIPQTVNGAYNGSAKVTVNIPNTWDTAKVFGYAKDDHGNVVVLAGKAEGGKFTFNSPHLTEVGIFEATDLSAVTDVTLMLELGETFSPITVSDSEAVGTAGTHTTPDGTVNYTVENGSGSGTGYEIDSDGIDSGSKYLITLGQYYVVSTTSSSSNAWNTNSLPIENINVFGSDDLSNYLWTITETNGGYYLQNPEGEYMTIQTGYYQNRNYTVTLGSTPIICDITRSGNGYMIFANNSSIGLNDAGGSKKTALGWWSTNNTVWTLYKQLAQNNTTVTFSALSITSGTGVTIGNTNYTVIVQSSDIKIDTFLKLNTSETLDPLSTLGLTGDGYSISYEITSDKNGILTLNGAVITSADVAGEAIVVATVTNASGDVVGTVTYNVTVADIIVTDTKNIYVPVGGTATVEGLTGDVYSELLNTEIASVAFSNGTLTVSGIAEGVTSVIIGEVQFNIHVIPNATNTESKYLYIYVEEMVNCEVYYSINGSSLYLVDGTGVLIDQTYNGGFSLSFFAAPHAGYALVEMSAKRTNNADGVSGIGSMLDFYSISDGITTDGKYDVTTTSAWPYKNGVYSTGFQWGVKQGNFDLDTLQTVFEEAHEKGCHGATTITKNSNADNGSAYFYAWFTFKAEKLPTLHKEIVSYKRGNQTYPYTEDVKLMFGDVLTYRFTITSSSTNVEYSDIVLDDSIIGYEKVLTNNLLNTAGTYTYTATYTIDKKDVALYAGGTLINNAKLTYNYKSNYSTGAYSGNASASAVCDIINLITYAWEEGTPEAIVNNLDGRFTLPDTDYYSGTEAFNTKVYTGETEYVVDNGKWVLSDYWGIDWNGTRYYYYKHSVVNTVQPAVGSRSFVFYGKWEFVPGTTELTIKKEGYSEFDTIDPNQTFLFKITGDTVDLTVTVHGESEVVVSGLKIGTTYTVTEITDWSWRYELDNWSFAENGNVTASGEENGAVVTLGNTDNEITFKNVRENDQWLDGDSYIVNIFKKKED